jgi:MFS family permease
MGHAPTPGAPAAAKLSPAGEAVFSRISWRILPLLLLGYMIAYLDRVNVGYAQLQMKETLPWDLSVYGLGAGIFFIGYFLFEVPSNMLLERIGARKTLLRIMVCWGLVAAGMMFVQTPTQFYIARFLLGVFEAGFFPGVILYFTYWYPSVKRGQVIATFMAATTIISVLAGPISGATLKYLNGVNGWHGWQWLFLVEGLPAVVLGVAAFLWLDDKPEQARWLSDAEKDEVLHAFAADAQNADRKSTATHGAMLRDPRLWALTLVYFCLLGATYTMVFWVPTLIQSWGVKDLFKVGLLAAIPNAVGAVGMVLIGRSSDRRNERRLHFVAAVWVAALSLFATTLLQGNLAGSLIALSIAVVGLASATPLFFAMVSEYLPASVAAVGIAMINCLGNLAGSIAPYINARITQLTGSNTASMYLVVALYVMSGLLLLATVRTARARHPAGAMQAA